MINHLWKNIFSSSKDTLKESAWWGKFTARSITFISIVVAWVFFRAENIPTGIEIIKGMLGANGIILPPDYIDHFNHFLSMGTHLQNLGVQFEDNIPYFKGSTQLILIFILLITVLFLPNTHQIFWKYSPALDSTSITDRVNNNLMLKWRPSATLAIFFTLLMAIIIFTMDSTSEFLYFQF